MGQQPMRCPECGDEAVHEPPTDPVPWEALGMTRPEWSHADRSSLCPVLGDTVGYQPAQPEPKPTTLEHQSAGTPAGQADAQPSGGPGRDVHTARLDPPATMRARWQAVVETAAGAPARQRSAEHELRLAAGTTGILGRQYLTRAISRLGELHTQARPDREPEAGS